MIVNVEDSQTSLKISSDQVKRLVQEVIEKEGQVCDEVNIYFVDTPAICKLHEEFFDDPSPTDCISFPLDEDPEGSQISRLLGEVFICPETALAYAKKHQANPYEETTLYILHGLLHLMGHGDIEEQEAASMRKAEERHMQNLRQLNLLLGCN